MHKCFWGLAGFRRRKKEKPLYFHFLVACKKCIKKLEEEEKEKVERVKIRKVVDVKREREIEVERSSLREKFRRRQQKNLSPVVSGAVLLTKILFFGKSQDFPKNEESVIPFSPRW